MSSGIINLTPHDVVVVGDDSDDPLHTFPAHGGQARLTSAEQRLVEIINGNVPVYEPQKFTGIAWPENLPKNPSGVIVSMAVGEHCRLAAEDKNLGFRVYGPDTSPAGAVRNDKGQIVGTKRLVRYV